MATTETVAAATIPPNVPPVEAPALEAAAVLLAAELLAALLEEELLSKASDSCCFSFFFSFSLVDFKRLSSTLSLIVELSFNSSLSVFLFSG